MQVFKYNGSTYNVPDRKVARVEYVMRLLVSANQALAEPDRLVQMPVSREIHSMHYLAHTTIEECEDELVEFMFVELYSGANEVVYAPS